MKSSQALEEGVYVYEGREPLRKTPPAGRPLIIYFDNRKCMFCRRFDPKWEALSQALKQPSDPLPVRVVCTFFANDCRDEHARSLFEKHGVSVTPLLIYTSPTGATRRFPPQRLWEMEVEDLLLILRSLAQGL